MSMSVGLSIGSTLANTAPANTMQIHTTAHQNRVPKRRPRRTGVSTGVWMLRSSAAMTNPRIEHRVQHVDDEIHDDEAGGDEQHDALQDNQIASIDRADQQPANSGQCKNR